MYASWIEGMTSDKYRMIGRLSRNPVLEDFEDWLSHEISWRDNKVTTQLLISAGNELPKSDAVRHTA